MKKDGEWHLTPRGWVRGNDDDPPHDRVLTMSCEESEHSVNCREVWSAATRDQIKTLIEQFGSAPRNR